jgi:hypothetical protein
MPVDMDRYPENWKEISYTIRFERGGGVCECTGECGTLHVAGRCTAVHGEKHPLTGSTVILTTAHLGVDKPDGTPGDKHDKLDARPENLKGMCQRCHLLFDLDEHMANARVTRNAVKLKTLIDNGQLSMGI